MTIAARRRLSGLLRLMLIASACLLGGCGRADGPPRYVVTGEVTYQGQPVPHGQILFDPDAEGGNHGPGGGALIENGRYTADPGIVGGPHRVRITGSDGVPVEIPGEGLDPLGTSLFPEYHTTFDFPRAATTWNVEVEASPAAEQRRE